MLLLIDVGNTNIVMGMYDGDEFKFSWRLGTKVARTSDEYGLQVDSILRHYGVDIEDITDVVLASVVPSIQHTLKTMCTRYLGKEPMVIGEGTKTGMKIKYDNPKEVGADRIVNAVAAYQRYGGPCLIIDIGTAISFDVVSKDGEYLGGAIAPGIGISSEALFSRTSKLPRVELEEPKNVIGKNTVEAIQSGVVYGFIGLVDNIISNILSEMRLDQKDIKIIATGGYAQLIATKSKYVEEYDYDITLQGMKMIYEKTIKERNEKR
ncbi:MAG: type III pantothenate kinase [Tissierellia bacterium]|nr:type III pantothenate kinase [Tissierellia bacterium]